MQPISINVQIQVGVTDQLYKLLAPLANLPAGTRQAQIPAREKKPVASKEPEVVNQKQAAQEEAAPAAGPKPEPESAAADHKPEQHNYTEVDVRAAMDRTRKRIEGEDYKENTGSEGYRKWHRALTAWFKNTATVLGAEKPSALPDSESRGSFIAHCDAVYVKEDELVENCPF